MENNKVEWICSFNLLPSSLYLDDAINKSVTLSHGLVL